MSGDGGLSGIAACFSRLPRSLLRFLVTGVSAVATDGICYVLLLWLGMAVTPAKSAGFVAGAVVSYFANRFWAFDDAKSSQHRLFPFLLLYVAAILLNVAVNRTGLEVIGTGKDGLAISWFLASGASATLNYFGLRYVVFPRSRL